MLSLIGFVWLIVWSLVVLAKQPTAASEIVRTTTKVRGYGEAYWQDLADWHLVVNQLAKPTLDDQLGRELINLLD